ncbi:hypothetical protein ACQHIV_39855 [Kribbella sp. GL6]|uniref:hypothetical protein n=1 Tax=Kribbella sp. GL6 TaxID=3419765 RepID=UPI003D0137B0
MVLDPHVYRELLRTALSPAVDADTIDPDARTLYTPTSHRRALDPDVTVVQGGRGVGKTVWFKALQNRELRSLTADEYQLGRLNRIDALPGYGTALLPEQYPSQRVLSALLAQFPAAEDIWTAVVLNALEAPGIVEQATWADRVRWLLANPEQSEIALAAADRDAASRDLTRLFLFDALDRLHSRRDAADKLVSGILRVALDLRTRTRNLRAKVFIRHDMFDGIKLTFPDASKLTANAADLTWSPTNLYGLLFHQLGNASHPASESFIRETGRWITQSDHRRTPPRDLTGDQARQREVFTQIAGPYMGREHRKGITYTWLPNHLTDGINQVSPRSFLSALDTATDITAQRFSTHSVPLHWEGIRQGVQTASKIRVVEIREDIPWVGTCVEPLRGMQVPIEQDEIVARWRDQDLKADLEAMSQVTGGDADLPAPAPTGPLHTDYQGLITELIELGVMSRRVNGKIDLPDVYRIAFDIGRKGGVPRVRS